jgi:hypothetical protein
MPNYEKNRRDRGRVTPRWDSFNAFVAGRGHDVLLGGIVLGGVVGFVVVAVVTGIGAA